MRFLMLLCGDESVAEHASDETMAERCHEWQEEMARRGVKVSAHGLRPPAEARTVRVRDGEVLLTDGPFAETKEQVGGLTIIECSGRDEAVRAGSEHPWAGAGTIEVRQLLEP